VEGLEVLGDHVGKLESDPPALAGEQLDLHAQHDEHTGL
jgi:hypothetical protein